MLTKQRGHILEVGLASIVGVLGEHQAHEHPYRLLALAYALKDGTRPTALQRFHRITNTAEDCCRRGVHLKNQGSLQSPCV